MTAYQPARPGPGQKLASRGFAAGALIRSLTWLAIVTVAAAALLFGLSSPIGRRWFPNIHLPGLGLATGSLLIAALGLVACLAMLVARQPVTAKSLPTRLATTRLTVSWPQTIIVLLFAAAAVYAVLADWPLRQAGPATAGLATMEASGGFTAASVLLLLATPWLLADRYVATITAQRLPERDALRSLLFLPVFVFGTDALLLVAEQLDFGTLYWLRAGLSFVLLLICVELTLRVLATWFLPPPDSAAPAKIGSILAGLLRGRSLSPTAMASTVRSQFGMDFSRSWALHFVRSAAAPVALLMLVFCWFLTGVTRIDLNQRGSYERFGDPVSVLQPGLHLVLPWPFGVVRHLEFGVMHEALISYGDQAKVRQADDHSTAEGDAPADANRLWDAEQPTDVSYIIASSEQSRQSFQTVSASVRVLYRIGLTDADARATLYHVADPELLVRSLAGRALAQFFAARTLPIVLGENQAVIAEDLRADVRNALDRLDSGIDVVTVTVEAIHPPAGAATAYRNVQAAEIAATTAIATERGRSQTTRSIADRDAHGAIGEAAGAAAETVSAAAVDLTNITADERPYRAASKPFLLERYLTDLTMALRNVPLEIVDHRLTGSSLPTIDLRSLGDLRSPGDLGSPGMIQNGAAGRRPAMEKTP